MVTERVVLLVIERLRKCYAHMKLWRLSAWTFSCTEEHSSTLGDILGTAYSLQYLQALPDGAFLVCPSVLSGTALPCGHLKKPMINFKERRAVLISTLSLTRC